MYLEKLPLSFIEIISCGFLPVHQRRWTLSHRFTYFSIRPMPNCQLLILMLPCRPYSWRKGFLNLFLKKKNVQLEAITHIHTHTHSKREYLVRPAFAFLVRNKMKFISIHKNTGFLKLYLSILLGGLHSPFRNSTTLKCLQTPVIWSSCKFCNM